MLRSVEIDIRKLQVLLEINKGDPVVQELGMENRRLREALKHLQIVAEQSVPDRSKGKDGCDSIDLRQEKVKVVRRIKGDETTTVQSYFFDDSDSESTTW